MCELLCMTDIDCLLSAESSSHLPTNYICSYSVGCAGLGVADPQFSAPSELSYQDQADDRIDEEDISSIDPALLQAVLADPILLQAVDPHVLQAVLVQAATANLQLELDTARQSSTAPPPTIHTTSTTPHPVKHTSTLPPPSPAPLDVQDIHFPDPQPATSEHIQVSLPQIDIVQDRFQTRFGPEQINRLIVPPLVPHPTPADCHVASCDPGLAYNPLTRSCEWPDTLLDTGCNPEGLH